MWGNEWETSEGLTGLAAAWTAQDHLCRCCPCWMKDGTTYWTSNKVWSSLATRCSMGAELTTWNPSVTALAIPVCLLGSLPIGSPPHWGSFRFFLHRGSSSHYVWLNSTVCIINSLIIPKTRHRQLGYVLVVESNSVNPRYAIRILILILISSTPAFI